MSSRDEAEDRAVAGAGSSETASGIARPRNRRLLFVGMAIGVGILGYLSWLFTGVFLRPENAQPKDAGPSEHNSLRGASGHSLGEAVAGPQAEMQALRQQAFDLADRVVSEFPEAADAICMKGLVHNRYGKRTEAVQCWQKCLELDPSYAAAYYCLGRNSLDRADYEESARLLRKAVQIDPEMADAHLLLAKALMGWGKMEEAVAALEEHIWVSPRSTEGYFRLGQAYLHLNRYEKAKQYHKAAIDIHSACTPAYYGLATACERLGQKEEAGKHRETFQELKAKDRIAEIGRQRDYDDLASLRQSLANAYVTAANVYQAHGNVPEAEQHWLKAAALSPQDTESRKVLVSIYEQQDKAEETLRVLKELSEIEPENVVHHINVGVLNMRLQRFDAAEAAFQKANELAPERPEAYVALSQLYLQANRKPAEAQTAARKAVELEPVAANYFLLGAACEKGGDYAGALTAIREATELDPGNLRYREAYDRIRKRQ